MKILKKHAFFGIAVFLAIILGFTACGDGSGNGNGNTGNGNGNQNPGVSDFTIRGIGVFSHDGEAKTVTVTAKQGKTSGAVTVKYDGSTTAPSAVNTYTVTFDVAAAAGWNSASGLSAGKLTIVPTGGPLVLAHFMPWHGGPEYKNQENQNVYNGHWRGDDNWKNPMQIVGGDKSEIASHVYPLTGPYNGKSRHLLQYQVGLMKLAGIGGVLICWYGASNDYDAPFNQQISIAMVEMITEANLKFSVVIEDWNTNGAWPTNNSRDNINWLRDNWFSKANYVKVGDRPLLLSLVRRGI
jgi:hypothetical protein